MFPLIQRIATFVRVLMGKLKHTAGTIFINGIPKAMSG
jgi:ABC-type multidrug transport system ATPase subunit